MKNILLIGVGGTGSRAANIFFKKYKELGNHKGNHVTALVFDTDAGDIKSIDSATSVVMADVASVGTICDRLGHRILREWFPCDDPAVCAQEMLRGASQWRKKSYLAFLNLMNKPIERSKFTKALERMVANPGGGCEIYVISSVAGGTGSGSFIPIALYAKRYLREKLGKDPIVNAMIALPEIYADAQTPENRTKIYANAYAILRELNAINLVARNYNAGRADQKKAPIKFRIGHPDDPNVGVLFDASDKRYWTPEAAPFSQVFLLDRIPGVDGIEAHDIILANSLYTILCTDIGSQFDSEFSNHELLRSQNNGSNAIYAGISTSQIKFPTDTILDYIAHEKALEACDKEWMLLHRKVEKKIRDKERQLKELGKPFYLEDGEYAKIVLEAYDEFEENGSCENLTTIVNRGIAEYDKDKRRLPLSTVVDNYVKNIRINLNSKIPGVDSAEQNINATIKINPKGKSKQTPAVLKKDKIEVCTNTLLPYFKKCVEEIKRVASSSAEAIITLDKRDKDYAESEWSLQNHILSNNKGGKKFIHPVAALIQLCYFRRALLKEIGTVEEAKRGSWPQLTQRVVDQLPSNLIKVASDFNPNEKGGDDKKSSSKVKRNSVRLDKSFYLKRGDTRFDDIDSMENLDKIKSDVNADRTVLRADALSTLYNIRSSAQTQLRKRVLAVVAENVDILIEKYRSFFTRFEKEKEDLKESVKDVKGRDAGIVGGVINVYSSAIDKEAIYEKVKEEGGPATEKDVTEMDNVVGRGVYETVYNSAVAARSQDENWNDKDSGAYRDIFGNMISSYREFVGKSDAFLNIASCNVLEALIESSGDRPDSVAAETKLKEIFSNAQEKAKPSLKVTEGGNYGDLVRPSTITVFMISVNTARYIKKHASEFGLRLPDDQTNEKTVISSCTEQFVRDYSGNTGARVTIVDSIPDNMLYCTGEIMDITPLRIPKFDELSKNDEERRQEVNEYGLNELEKADADAKEKGKDNGNLYYRCYCEALRNSKKYDTDMWNPHIGNNLHKRGYLPFMNEAKEKECDTLVVKALIYGFVKKKIVYSHGIAEFANKYYFTCDGKKITDANGNWINEKNIAQLVSWMRDDDALYEDWSDAFDTWLREQVNKLPTLNGNTSGEISTLEGRLTQTEFMKLLTGSLYDSGDKKNPSLLEFAYMVKNTEEVGCDCDDAERIICVASDIFKKLCGSRIDINENAEIFVQIYRQQLDNIYDALSKCSTVRDAGNGKTAIYRAIVSWLNKNDAFLNISVDNPINSRGEVCIDQDYDVGKKELKDDIKKAETKK